MRPKLLFLSHRLPYPPDKGEKIRAWHILRFLAPRFDVHLGSLCFSEEERDAAAAPALRALCRDVHAPRITRGQRIFALLGGMRPGLPLMPAYYHLPALQNWVRTTLAAGDFAVIFIYTAAMAPYVLGAGMAAARGRACVLLDAVDINSEKWAEYASTSPFPKNLFWAREARTLLAYERHVAARADATFFVTAAETARFTSLAPECAGRVHSIENGVDTAYFDPAIIHPNPYAPGSRNLIFSGTMNYWPNQDAAVFFARQIMPGLRARHPDLCLTIAGADPSEAVRALASLPGVQVTGRVADMRPYLAHADAAVCPLRIARGIQNKVLEAMAMARPVVASPQAFEGVDARPGRDLLLAADDAAFATHVGDILAGAHAQMGAQAREAVLTRYAWDATLSPLDGFLPSQP